MSAATDLRALGGSLFYTDPRGAGRPVVFVHGFSHNGAVWDVVGSGLPEGYRPIAIDLRGHGESPWSVDGRYGLEDYARDLSEFLEVKGLEGVHLVGHSLGGNVATLCAAEQADRVRSLSLIDTGPSLRAEAAQHIVGEVDEALRAYESVRAYRRLLALIHPFGAPELLDELATRSLVERRDGRFELALDPAVLGMGSPDFDLAVVEEELWSAFRSIERPIFIARGGLSSVLDESIAEQMRREAITGSRLETFARAGHAVMIDAADALSDSLRAFVCGVDAAVPSVVRSS